MFGAIIGDISGSRYEFNNVRTMEFELMDSHCEFTDDTVCTVAVADALLNGRGYADALQDWCRRYPHPMGGYGSSFANWIHMDNPKPYGSYGNGCAMRVSPCGFLADDEDSAGLEARKAAGVSHDHHYALDGAELIARAIFRLRNGEPKETAALHIEKVFGWLPEYRPFSNPFDETVMNAVPVAVSCFLASDSFEDAIRKSIIVGGDSDTIAAICGGLAEAYYGIPEDLKQKALTFLPDDMKAVIRCQAAR